MLIEFIIDPYIMENETSTFASMIVDHSQEFLRDLAYDLRKREWDRLGEDYEVILDDCPENTNCKACGPYFCSGYNITFNHLLN